jgi:hypothetical protein
MLECDLADDPVAYVAPPGQRRASERETGDARRIERDREAT